MLKKFKFVNFLQLLGYRFDHFEYYKEKLGLTGKEYQYERYLNIKEYIYNRLNRLKSNELIKFETLKIPDLSLEVFKSNLEYRNICRLANNKLQALIEHIDINNTEEINTEEIRDLESTIQKTELLLNLQDNVIALELENDSELVNSMEKNIDTAKEKLSSIRINNPPTQTTISQDNTELLGVLAESNRQRNPDDSTTKKINTSGSTTGYKPQ